MLIIPRKSIIIFSILKGYSAITLWPFIFFASSTPSVITIRHELIHFRQQRRWLIIPFYIIYLMNYLFELLKRWRHTEAYMNIVFEKEAYNNQMSHSYLPEDYEKLIKPILLKLSIN